MKTPKVWTQRHYDFTRRTIASRRQRRKLSGNGFIETDPTECGWALFDELRQNHNRIAEVVISTDGTRLFIKLERPRKAKAQHLPGGLECGVGDYANHAPR